MKARQVGLTAKLIAAQIFIFGILILVDWISVEEAKRVPVMAVIFFFALAIWFVDLDLGFSHQYRIVTVSNESTILLDIGINTKILTQDDIEKVETYLSNQLQEKIMIAHWTYISKASHKKYRNGIEIKGMHRFGYSQRGV